MLHTRFVSLVALSVVTTVACMEVEQPLGDATSAGQSGSGGAGGSGTTGGSGGTVGGTGTTGGAGGASTSGAAGRLPMPGGAGTSSSGGSTARGGTGGDMGEAGEGNAPGAGGGTPGDCYSPSNPAGALHGAEGCPCGAADEDQCLAVREGVRPHLVALSCLGGQWQSVEDGACDVVRGCLVDDRLYRADGENSFSSPLDTCNSCGCSEGGLSCTEIGCDSVTCPAGMTAGSTCFQCGSAGGCAIMEYGCVPACDEDSDCGTFGVCRDDGICDQGCD